jgi:cation diffusion facilitator family transporter
VTDASAQVVTPEPAVNRDAAARYVITRRVTLIGAASNVVLAITQFTVGIAGHSQALVADAIHSLSDLLTDILAVFGAKHASRAADQEHPYGHGRVETVATVALSLVLVIAGGVIISDAVRRLLEPQRLLQPTWAVLVVALASVVVKELMYRYTLRVARTIRSKLLQINAWHHRSDALSSIIVIVGVIGTMNGIAYLDAVAAIGVALMIARVGLKQIWDSVQELIDHGLDKERLAMIRDKILGVSGVNELHLLRTRRVGGNAFVDVHVLVDPKLSVSEAHQISETVRATLITDIDEVTDVTIHIDPEDDLVTRPNWGLPARAAVVAALRTHWAAIPEAAAVENITLHYLSGKLHVDVDLPMTAIGSLTRADEVARQIARLGKKEQYIAEIRVAFVSKAL